MVHRRVVASMPKIYCIECAVAKKARAFNSHFISKSVRHLLIVNSTGNPIFQTANPKNVFFTCLLISSVWTITSINNPSMYRCTSRAPSCRISHPVIKTVRTFDNFLSKVAIFFINPTRFPVRKKSIHPRFKKFLNREKMFVGVACSDNNALSPPTRNCAYVVNLLSSSPSSNISSRAGVFSSYGVRGVQRTAIATGLYYFHRAVHAGLSGLPPSLSHSALTFVRRRAGPVERARRTHTHTHDTPHSVYVPRLLAV